MRITKVILPFDKHMVQNTEWKEHSEILITRQVISLESLRVILKHQMADILVLISNSLCIVYRLMVRFESTGSIWDAKNNASWWKTTVIIDNNRVHVRRILRGSTNYFHSIGVPTIKHIQNIITKTHESIRFASMEGDTVWRRDFGNYIVEEFENGSINEHKIWFSDEAHFQLNGWVNRQNCCHWVQKIFISVSSLHYIQRITVWCVISSKRTIGPLFIDSMITGVKYRVPLSLKLSVWI